MLARNILLLGIILEMHLCGDFICTVELMREAALELYVLFVNKIFAIHRNMGLAQCGNTCWQKLTSPSGTN